MDEAQKAVTKLFADIAKQNDERYKPKADRIQAGSAVLENVATLFNAHGRIFNAGVRTVQNSRQYLTIKVMTGNGADEAETGYVCFEQYNGTDGTFSVAAPTQSGQPAFSALTKQASVTYDPVAQSFVGAEDAIMEDLEPIIRKWMQSRST